MKVQNKDFQYKHDAEEDQTFSLVDTSKSASKRFGGAQRRTWGKGGKGLGWGKGGKGKGGKGEGKGKGAGDQPQRRRTDLRAADRKFSQQQGKGKGRRMGRVDREASCKVQADWVVVEELDLAQFAKLQTNKPVEEDLRWCGHVEEYDESFDPLTTKTAKPLNRVENREFYNVRFLHAFHAAPHFVCARFFASSIRLPRRRAFLASPPLLRVRNTTAPTTGDNHGRPGDGGTRHQRGWQRLCNRRHPGALDGLPPLRVPVGYRSSEDGQQHLFR